MIRKVLLAAFSLGLLFWAGSPGQAQAAERAIELRLVGLSQGYTRPLRATSERLGKVRGLKDVRAVSHRAGITRFTARTVLPDEEIARALGLKLLDAREGALLLAPAAASEAWRAEARLAILAIVEAIRERQQRQRRNMWDELPNLFPSEATTEQALKVLGLDPRMLDGRFFKIRDYHIEEEAGWNGTYKVWAGERYAPVPVGNLYDFDFSSNQGEEPDPKARFVGAKMNLNSWSGGFWWVDIHGSALNGMEYERDATDPGSGKLAVQVGAERLATLLEAAARYRFKENVQKKSKDELHKGSFGNWQLKSELGLGDDYWDCMPFYNDNAFSLSWFKHEQTGHLHARVKALYPSHALHLDGDLDVDAAKAADFNFAKVPVRWTVGAESDVNVFEQRRTELSAGLKVLRDALFALQDPPPASNALSGKALCAALSLAEDKLKGTHFSAADYLLLPQMLGDWEIRAGSSATGGASWTLVSFSSKTDIRSYR